MKIYITEMLRWGGTETHHYIIGAYSTKEDAEFYGDVEKSWRGGKYESKVVEINVDDALDEKKFEHYKACISREIINT